MPTKIMILLRKSSLVLLTDTGAGLVGAELLNSLVGVSCWKKKIERSSRPLLYQKQSYKSIKNGRYLIKKIDCDIIKKGHISSSVPLSVHRLFGRFQETPQADTFVHICFRDNNHPLGAFVLLFVLLLVVRVAPCGHASPPSDPISNCTVPITSSTSGDEGKSQSEWREGERETS